MLCPIVFRGFKMFEAVLCCFRSAAEAIFYCLGSAITAAFNSLLTERILKNDKARYHVQKVRLDASGLVAAIAFVPIIGLISERPQDVPWDQRPVDASCPRSSVCWKEDGCGDPLCGCECGGGVFAGWVPEAVAVIVLAIVINTAYGWLVGKLVQALIELMSHGADRIEWKPMLEVDRESFAWREPRASNTSST